MPRGYLWCEASPGSTLTRHYYETDGRWARRRRAHGLRGRASERALQRVTF
jgi:hypothetical protein